MKDHKIIHDSVHGSIRVNGPALSLIETPELQRLHSIHQLGLAYLVYPGANHTRFEHSLGTFAVARRICTSLNLSKEEGVLIECAALLHDVGHLPFSHTLEFVLHDQFKIDHEEISKRLIRGEESVVSDTDGKILGKFDTVAEALEKRDVDLKEVAKLLDKTAAASAQKTIGDSKGQSFFNSRRYMSQIITGPVDADQLDYLKRDAHYTGVAYGVIDLDRLYETLQIFNGDLVVDRGGLSAVEGMLVARALMFSSVYFHKTVRIAELMLAKAVEQLGAGEVASVSTMTDSGLLAHLGSKGGYFEEIATLIKYRRLYKKSFALRMSEVSPERLEEIEGFGDMRSRRSLEQDIARRAGVDPGRVLIDIPSTELMVSEPRISLTNLRVIDDGKVRMLHKMSPIAASLQLRRVHEWALMVACPAKDRENVRKASEKVLAH